MSEPTKAELLSVICELQDTVTRLASEYSNDVSPNRAGAIGALEKHGVAVAQNCIERFPYSKIEGALHRFPQPVCETSALRRGC